MCSSMRLVVFIFVCFAASTAVNSTHRNSSGTSEHEMGKAIPSQMVGLSDEPPTANNESMSLRLKRGQADWCSELKDQPVEDVMTSCNELWASDDGYVLRVDKNVNEEMWKYFTDNLNLLMVDVEIDGSSLTELNLVVDGFYNQKFIVKNNPLLKNITISPKHEEYMGISAENMEIKGNPELTSIKINGNSIDGNLAISNNEKLETIELETANIGLPQYYRKFHGYDKRSWTISKNPLLHIIQLRKNIENWIINGSFEIVENKGLSRLDLPQSAQFFLVNDIKIANNDNLGGIKIPAAIKEFSVDKLEIRQNTKLTSIELGEQTKWNETGVIVQENPALSPDVLETLKAIEWKTRDIQGDDGEKPTTSSKASTSASTEKITTPVTTTSAATTTTASPTTDTSTTTTASTTMATTTTSTSATTTTTSPPTTTSTTTSTSTSTEETTEALEFRNEMPRESETTTTSGGETIAIVPSLLILGYLA